MINTQLVTTAKKIYIGFLPLDKTSMFFPLLALISIENTRTEAPRNVLGSLKHRTFTVSFRQVI